MIIKNRKIITKKAFVLIVAVLVLLTSLFAGCSQSKTNKPTGKADSAAETTTAGAAVNEKLTVSEEKEDSADADTDTDGVQGVTNPQSENGKGAKTSSKAESTTSKSTNGSGNGKADKAETTKAPSTTESSTKQNGFSPTETTTLNEQDGEWGAPVKN